MFIYYINLYDMYAYINIYFSYISLNQHITSFSDHIICMLYLLHIEFHYILKVFTAYLRKLTNLFYFAFSFLYVYNKIFV